jgi:TAT (twin-arginine translocation) pathway signal sequence
LAKSPKETRPDQDPEARSNAAIDRRSFLASSAAAGAVATTALPAQSAQAADGLS